MSQIREWRVANSEWGTFYSLFASTYFATPISLKYFIAPG